MADNGCVNYLAIAFTEIDCLKALQSSQFPFIKLDRGAINLGVKSFVAVLNLSIKHSLTRVLNWSVTVCRNHKVVVKSTEQMDNTNSSSLIADFDRETQPSHEQTHKDTSNNSHLIN